MTDKAHYVDEQMSQMAENMQRYADSFELDEEKIREGLEWDCPHCQFKNKSKYRTYKGKVLDNQHMQCKNCKDTFGASLPYKLKQK